MSCLLLKVISRQEAYEKLGEVLSRKEFQGWINPFEIIERLFGKLQKIIIALPPGLQIVIAAILVLILILIFYHWAAVLRRFVSSKGKGKKPSGVGDLEALLRTRAAPGEIKSKALQHLKNGEVREATRLLYVYFILLLRDRGMIPKLSSLTGREISRMLKERIGESEKANRLFEKSAYSRHPASPEDAEWMLKFVEGFERSAE